jgi:hypothetical protein
VFGHGEPGDEPVGVGGRQCAVMATLESSGMQFACLLRNWHLNYIGLKRINALIIKFFRHSNNFRSKIVVS